jgi:hypothetical protein
MRHSDQATQALDHLLTAATPFGRVGDLLEHGHARQLALLGMRQYGDNLLAIAICDPEVLKLFRRTQWSNGIWQFALSRLEGAVRQRVRIGGRPVAAIVVPYGAGAQPFTELPEALQMDDTPNTHPLRIHRDPPRRSPWRRLLFAAVLLTALFYGLGFAAHALADWVGMAR